MLYYNLLQCFSEITSSKLLGGKLKWSRLFTRFGYLTDQFLNLQDFRRFHSLLLVAKCSDKYEDKKITVVSIRNCHRLVTRCPISVQSG